MRFSMRVAVGLLLVSALAGGCKKAGGHGSGSGEGSSAAAGEVKTFPIRGKVVSVDATKGSVLLDHEAVLAADVMTMSYKPEGYGDRERATKRAILMARWLVTKTLTDMNPDARSDCGDGAGEAGL